MAPINSLTAFWSITVNLVTDRAARTRCPVLASNRMVSMETGSPSVRDAPQPLQRRPPPPRGIGRGSGAGMGRDGICDA